MQPIVIPITRSALPAISAPVTRVEQSVASKMVSAMDAAAEDLLDLLDQSAPPPKRIRRRLGRGILVTGVATIASEAYLVREHELQQLARYRVRNRLPAVLAGYHLVFERGIDPDRVFDNGLLSEYAICTILGAVTDEEADTTTIPAVTASRQREVEHMTHTPSGAAAPRFIAGVNVPVIDAEPDVIAAFNKYHAEAIKDAHLAVDASEEIARLIAKGERLLEEFER